MSPCSPGDTLFIGDVGRPDLSRTHSPRELAGLLYDSLHQKLLTLPDAGNGISAHRCGVALRTRHGGGALVPRSGRSG